MCGVFKKLWLKFSPTHRKKEQRWQTQCRKIRQQRNRHEIERLCESSMRYGPGLKTNPSQKLNNDIQTTDGLNFVYKPPNASHGHYI